MKQIQCLYCGGQVGFTSPDYSGRAMVALIACQTCGSYEVGIDELSANPRIPPPGSRRVSALLRAHFDATAKPFPFDRKAERIRATELADLSVTDRLERTLLVIADRTGEFGETVHLAPLTDWPLAMARSGREFQHLLAQQRDVGYVSINSAGCSLTATGWQRVDAIRRVRTKSDQAFVAMWFDPSMNAAFDDGFEPGLLAASYKAQRVDREQHVQKICDRIVADIRQSGILVADFTGDRGGVYFEAGFAMGLGTPVIWSCREDYVDRLHFDTRQYNHLVWREPGDLRLQLCDRVRALFPRAK